MSRLLNEELSEIRERAEKATEGKWYYEIDGDLYSEKARERVMYPYLTAESIPYIKVSKEDAAFIAHAREDIPKLLAEVDRLNKIIEECGKDLGSIEGNILGTIGSFTHVSVRLSDIMDVKDKLEEAIGNERK